MAAFIVGLVGYGISLLSVACSVLSFKDFGNAPRGSVREKSGLLASVVFAVFAVGMAVGTHWFIKGVL